MKPLKEYDFLKPEVFSQVEGLELRAKKIVEGLLTGVHRSPYLGSSVEFAGHREYVAGDDIKKLDWKIWGRSDKFFIKQFEEETNLVCYLVVDASRSMAYDGIMHETMSKFQYACTVAAVLLLLINRQADGVGLTVFDEQLRISLNPGNHPSHALHLIHALSTIKPSNRTDMKASLHLLAEKFLRKGVVILISDLFVDLEDFKNALKHFRYRGHEVIVMQIMHIHELEFPFSENVQFEGMESSDAVSVDSFSVKKAYLEVVGEHNNQIKKICASFNYDYLLISTQDSLENVLRSYLSLRQKARK